MSQQTVDRTLGKLVTDEAFRERSFAAPAEATWEAGLVLSPVELDSLSRLSREAVVRFSEAIDRRISRPCLAPTRREGHRS